MRRIGIGYRHPLARWVDARPREIGCLEITAEHFYDGEPAERRLRALAGAYPVFIHGLGLSLGTPGPLDRDAVDRFARVARIADPRWVSEHVAFTRSEEIDLGHLNPVQPTRESLRIIADHVREVSERCGKPMIVENITSHLRLAGEMAEPEFLNRLCDAADCGLLLDVTNLYINAKNHRFDARAWLRELDGSRIVQLHVVGFAMRDGVYHDSHATPIQDDLLDLAGEVAAHAGEALKAAIIERDADFPPAEEYAGELRRLEAAVG